MLSLSHYDGLPMLAVAVSQNGGQVIEQWRHSGSESFIYDLGVQHWSRKGGIYRKLEKVLCIPRETHAGG